MIELRDFDKSDWYAWAGAEAPASGEPQIDYGIKGIDFPYDLSECIVIHDANALAVYVTAADPLTDNTEIWYELETTWATGCEVLTRMTQPLSPSQLETLGFKLVGI